MTDENELREAAYYNWLNKGCPENADVDCWLEAENAGVCPCCGKKECECGPDCECGCEKKATKKKACAKKATAAKEPKAAAKKAPAKKAAKK
ncbi:MAG: DUF2934 domain-containing protein [Alphaproteobacteria bacterium]|nr:DUF2934 domain-containing protein [Alphaproteobacteria bacterium]